ncbi:upstream activation factor subunit spp27-like [Chenopodium quinoa]|uniref:upstream activation factor subunit spp27-like n=1 Tax=Chenopodium quinoa TaxID=63459 RepID=UPI000B78C226|nr:upstream activation factor subunit spp27-like [Chenopodium quinoa]
MVSDSELAEKVHEFLSGSDLKKTTNNIIRKKLESDFGVDLSHKKPFLRIQVDRFLQTQYKFSEEQDDYLDAAVVRGDEGNDDVSDSEDDEYYEDEDEGELSVGGIRAAADTFKGISKFKRSRRQNKVKNKRVCESGKFCTLSPALQKFLGVPHLIRTEVVRRLWSYVRDKRLQDPQDGKTIICDETLHELFGVDSINILQIHSALTKHIWPSEKSVRREKPRKQEKEEDPFEAKPPRKVYSGFLAPLPLSDALVKFLGTGESALTRAVVIKRVWEYIKENNLQDPFAKKTVICDEKLKELFNVDSFNGFMVSKLLSAHFLKL